MRDRYRPSVLGAAHSALNTLLWLATGLVVMLLALRFGMRAVGVRDDIPLPGSIYSLTAPLVQPFYRLFPAPERFDYYAIEAASLAAAGSVVAAALALYVALLLLSGSASGLFRARRR